MRRINGVAGVPYSPKFEFSLVCFLCITFASTDVLGKSAYFDDISTRDIEAIEGQTVIIPCTVRNLSHEKIVSWIRMRDVHILTSGSHAFASDYRFEVVHSVSNEDFWGLRIRGVKADDTGQYECQVNTEPKLSLAYKLTVSKMGSDNTHSKWLGHAQIQGPREAFVQHGSSFLMTCEIFSSVHSKRVNLQVWWLLEDTQIQSQNGLARVSIETSQNKTTGTVHSILRFQYVTWQDSGVYTCLQPSVKKDSIKLVIVEAESSEAMQRDFPGLSKAVPSSFLGSAIVLSLVASMVLL
ncbi:zwei Ig domain protein zig-8-like [Euwallacea similis]|uniref:zwei Ig domain protein zig-8-like n=1 Tax=Euwallacea similis TaxID=1736056 RepID=UPI00344CEDEE